MGLQPCDPTETRRPGPPVSLGGVHEEGLGREPEDDGSFYLGVGWRFGSQVGGGECKLGTPCSGKRVRGPARAARGGWGSRAPSPGEGRGAPRACRGLHRGRVCTQRGSSPTAERASGRDLTHLLKSKGIVPPSRWERCRPGGPQRRVGTSPLPTPPWPPRPRQPARHSPLASRRREVTLRAAHWAPPPPPAAPSAARLKGPKGRRDEWVGCGMLPKLISSGFKLWFLLASDLLS